MVQAYFFTFVLKHWHKHFTNTDTVFLTKNTAKLFKSNRNRLNSTRAFKWCINCFAFQRIFFLNFLVRVPPYVKNGPKYFFIETWQFIHHLKALVEFRRFLWLLKSFTVFLVEKFSKNSEKIWIFDFFY